MRSKTFGDHLLAIFFFSTFVIMGDMHIKVTFSPNNSSDRVVLLGDDLMLSDTTNISPTSNIVVIFK